MAINTLFVFERETKNTVRYQEMPLNGEPEIIGALYLRKAAYEALEAPQVIEVTIKSIDS